jgi:hypothetical protein
MHLRQNGKNNDWLMLLTHDDKDVPCAWISGIPEGTVPTYILP